MAPSLVPHSATVLSSRKRASSSPLHACTAPSARRRREPPRPFSYKEQTSLRETAVRAARNCAARSQTSSQQTPRSSTVIEKTSHRRISARTCLFHPLARAASPSAVRLCAPARYLPNQTPDARIIWSYAILVRVTACCTSFSLKWMQPQHVTVHSGNSSPNSVPRTLRDPYQRHELFTVDLRVRLRSRQNPQRRAIVDGDRLHVHEPASP